jgi:hypothetical protein
MKITIAGIDFDYHDYDERGDVESARLRADVLRSAAEEIAVATGGPYSADELSEAREWLPLSSR